MQTIFPTKTRLPRNKAFIFGGAYGNLQATQAILEKAAELGFQSSEIIFTGDMIAYCANPVETVNLIKNSVDHIIMGNCEEAIASGSNDCGCGFEDGSQCSVLSNQWYNFCLSKMDAKTAQWMGTLPKSIHIEIGNHSFLATHATPHSINQFIFPSTLSDTLDRENYDGYIVGHSGIPFIGKIDCKPWINSGAAGMPANDGTKRVWYATMTCDDDKISIETNGIEYDHEATKLAMRQASLTNGYMDCLSTGIWPSHDVLPAHEKQVTGIRLQPQKKAFKRTPLINSIIA